jgi:hypothetical protein
MILERWCQGGVRWVFGHKIAKPGYTWKPLIVDREMGDE